MTDGACAFSDIRTLVYLCFVPYCPRPCPLLGLVSDGVDIWIMGICRAITGDQTLAAGYALQWSLDASTRLPISKPTGDLSSKWDG